MRSLSPADVERIAALADDYHADKPSPSIVSVGEAALNRLRGVDAKRLILYTAIRDLSHEQRGELYALMSIGRGDGERHAWDELVREGIGQSESTGPEEFADYMAAKMPLAQYLRDGLIVLTTGQRPGDDDEPDADSDF